MDRSEMMLSRDQVARRAFERFVSRGFSHGRALEDWLEAEAELRAEVISRAAAPTVVIAAPVAEPVALAPVATVETAPKATPAPTKPARKRRRK